MNALKTRIRNAWANRCLLCLIAPYHGSDEWLIVHHAVLKDIYTLERARRFFKGRYLIVTAQELIYRAGLTAQWWDSDRRCHVVRLRR